MFEIGKIYLRVKGQNLKFKVLDIGKTKLSRELVDSKEKQWATAASSLNRRGLERDLADRKLLEVEEQTPGVESSTHRSLDDHRSSENEPGS